MASLVNIATGNFTAAATWGVNSSAGTLLATSTAVTALTVAAQDSAVFVPGAVTVIGVVLRLASRAAGAPTNTITVVLRNSTGAVDVKTVVANVSDLPACSSGTDSEGGWHFFKFDAPVLLLAATNYLIRVSLSATTTAVSLATNGTAANWQRILVTDGTSAPAAGDDLFMAQTLDGATNPATVTARTVTMNETAATDYGSAVVSTYQPAVSVSKECTFTYGTTAATNYVLRISGLLSVYSGGVFRIGNTGAEIPRDSTAILEFDNASDGQFGIRCLNGSTFTAYGLSRTAAKEVWKTKLSADEAAGSTTIDVIDDTGWLNGDEVNIASTTRTSGQSETVTLNANAGATSFTLGVGLTNAHSGTGDYVAEVILLTRNVEIRSVSSTNMMYGHFKSSAVVFCSWMRWRYFSSIAGGGLFSIETTSAGSLTMSKTIFRNADQGVSFSGGTHGNWTFDQVTIAGIATAGNCVNIPATSGTWTFTDIVFFSNSATSVTFSDIGGTIGSLLFYSCGSCLQFSQTQNNAGTSGPTFSGGAVWTFHSNGGGATDRCIGFNAAVQDITFPTISMWRNNSDPIELDQGNGMFNVEFTGNFFGNGVSGTEEPCCFIAGRNNAIANLRFVSCNISGDTLFQANWGILFDGNNVSASEISYESCVFSENTGTRRPLLVADIGAIPDIESGGMYMSGIADNCMFGAPESIKYYLSTGPAPHLAQKASYVLCPRYNQTAGLHRVYTPYATHIIDTVTFDVTPSQNIKPIATGSTGFSSDSNAGRRNTGFMVAVNSGATVTPSVKVQIDAGYNGSTNPQLVVLKNRAAGINADTVLATHSGAVGSFETLSAATAAVAADCILEFVVRVYGNAGNVYVDTWSTLVAGQDSTGDRYWYGQPVTNANTSGGGAGATPTSVAYLG